MKNAKVDGLFPGTPSTEQEINGFEARYHVKLPLDIREYFFKVNGVWCEGTAVPRLYQLSKWDRLIDTEFYGTPYQEHAKQLVGNVGEYFFFGICPGAWVIRLTSMSADENSVYLLWDKATLIAYSFSDFLQKCRISNFDLVIPHW